MSEVLKQRHGLEAFLSSATGKTGGESGVSILVQPGLGHINLRGVSGDPGFFAPVEEVLGQDLPRKANSMTSGAHRVYWLGPDEWQVVTAIEGTAKLLAEISEQTRFSHVAATNVSGGFVSLRATGVCVRDLLAKGCTLDLHPSEFEPGACAQSGLAKASVLIGLLDSTPDFEIIVRRSFADYLAQWLARTGAEYNVSISKA